MSISKILENVVNKVGSAGSSNADFEPFVYADVATEPNGMELSVLSALSRRGLDPWTEARRLAQLPSFEAADGLAQVLRALPAIAALRLDAKAIAERLVALLPVRGVVTEGPFLSPSTLAAMPVQVPRGFTLVMMAALFGGMLVPLFMPKQADPVAPASWIAGAPQAPVTPQPIPGQSAASTFPDPSGAAATTTPPPSVP